MRMTHHHPNRPAFTLIELLIVMAIVAILTALATAGYFYAVGRQYEKNTNATIEHVYGILKQQWNHVIAEAKKETIPDTGTTAATNVKILAAPDSTGERARVIWIMLRLAEAFPTKYDEIQTPQINSYLGSNKPRYQTNYKNKIGALKSVFGQEQTESAACLYLALTTGKGGSAINPDQMPVKPAANADGLMELRDAWGHPIAFFRFPAVDASQHGRFAKRWPTLSGPKGAYFNPLDPSKTLQSSWNPVGNMAIFQNKVQFTIGTWFTTPVLASGGADNVLDLTFPAMAEAPGPNTKDNLYSFEILPP